MGFSGRLQANSSWLIMGGARSKIIVRHKEIKWIAKLNRDDDLFDNAKVEYA